jgi:hypothetical protein
MQSPGSRRFCYDVDVSLGRVSALEFLKILFSTLHQYQHLFSIFVQAESPGLHFTLYNDTGVGYLPRLIFFFFLNVQTFVILICSYIFSYLLWITKYF